MVTTRIEIGFLKMASFINYFAIFFCCLFFVPVSTQDDKITCSVPSVELFQNTVLTCHFPEDLSVIKKDFTVYHYVEQGNPEAVLDCWWVQGSQECYSKPGYMYNKRVSRSLNLTVDGIINEHVGKYACQVAGYESTFLEPCELLLKRDANNKCNLSKVNDSQITLTCFFNEDIKKTQKNFTVYKHKEQEKLAVIECWWENGNQRCREEKGYFALQDAKVSTYFTMAIPTATNEKTYNYSCWHGGSHGDQGETCSFVIGGNGVEPNTKKRFDTLALGLGLGLGLSLGILLLAVTMIAGIVLFLRKRRRNRASSLTQEEEPLMVSSENQPNKAIEEFQDFLLDKINDMYPNMLNECYFVPPVYFNKTRYSEKSVADQVFYVPDPPNLKDHSLDRAMQHVIHCLRHMADQYQEQMFVLTQFKYDDYLRCPSPEYTGHRLPVPGGLKGFTRDQDIGCFDFLIIHRQHGVVVGVLKTLSDKNDGSEDGERRTDELLTSNVIKCMKQLQRAKCIIQHLLSDVSPTPAVRLSSMLPNITKSTLRRAFGRTSRDKDDKTTETTIELCLCADHLSHPLRPWDVSTGVMSSFREWWDRLMSSDVDGPSMSDEMYRAMIARFCGPATVSTFEIDESKVYQLPKTLNEAVMLTGDLFERLTLNMNTLDFEEPRVCLCGPPGTGKSQTLALVGQKWICEGHTVHLINTCPEGSEDTAQLYNLLLKNSTGLSPNSPVKSIKQVFCNIENRKEIDKIIKLLIKDEKEKTFFTLLDEPDADENKLTQLQEFLQNIKDRLPNLHLWLAICRCDMAPPGWKGKLLSIPFTCPASIIRETCKETQQTHYSTQTNLVLTDGLPVKNVYHRSEGHVKKEPRDCPACGQEIVRFLTRDLRVTNQGTQNASEHLQPQSPQTTERQSPSVQWKDLLFLFETNISEKSPMIQVLKESGIPVQVINSKKNKNEQMKNVKGDKNIVLVANVGFPCVRKRKVVVYVEGDINRSTPSAKWNKLLSITRCASQLIVVRM